MKPLNNRQLGTNIIIYSELPCWEIVLNFRESSCTILIEKKNVGEFSLSTQLKMGYTADTHGGTTNWSKTTP